MASGSVVASLQSVTKSYGGVTALQGVSLDIRSSEIHAVVGENGAGKSTLMKMLAGAVRPDSGELRVGDEPVELRSVEAARGYGIGIVFQELSLFPDLDVLANLFPLREPRRFGLSSRRAMERRGLPALRGVGLQEVGPNTKVSRLSLAERQLLEIARALLEKPRILILDEPTSALNAQECDRLFKLITRLRDQGVAVLYVSHRLEEVFSISDRITVIRDGALVASSERRETSITDTVAAMLGRASEARFSRHSPAAASTDSPSLRLSRVTVGDALVEVDLEAAAGEIVGLAGLEGAGPQTVFDVLFGIARPTSGEVHLPSGARAPRSIRTAVHRGIARVPIDRRRQGLMLQRSLVDNIAAVSAGTLGRGGFFLSRSKLRAQAETKCRELAVRAGDPESAVTTLSGGNQQKVVLAKWLQTDPQVVLLDDPTRGVDVGSKVEMYRLIDDLAKENRTVLFYSTELDEYADLCDRTVVFYKGRVAGAIPAAQTTKAVLLEAVHTGFIPDVGPAR